MRSEFPGHIAQIAPRSFERFFVFVHQRRSIPGALLLIALTVFSMVSSNAVSAQNQESVDRAVVWLENQQGDDGGFKGFSGESDPGATVDALLALSAAKAIGIEVNFSSAITYLGQHALVYTQSGPGSAAKLALGLSAAGEDPRDIDGVNPMAIVEVAARSGMIGMGPFDHALGLLALVATGSIVPETAIEVARTSQIEDGSWAFDGSTEAGVGDSNTTAMMVQALIAVGLVDDETVSRGLQYLVALQAPEGGFPYQPGADPDANSTALGLQAIIASGSAALEDSRSIAEDALVSFQNESGAFRYQAILPDDNLFATTQAVPAVAGFALPLPSLVLLPTPAAAASPVEATPAA